jgi:hypothetical protein
MKVFGTVSVVRKQLELLLKAPKEGETKADKGQVKAEALRNQRRSEDGLQTCRGTDPEGLQAVLLLCLS